MATRCSLDSAKSSHHQYPSQTTDLSEKSSDDHSHQAHEVTIHHDLDAATTEVTVKQKMADNCSSPDSGIEVCDAIHILLPLAHDRYKFGICANIEPSELELIMDQHTEPVRCLSNIVDRWNRTNCTKSWSALANVVEKMQNYEQVAASLWRMAGYKDKGKELQSQRVSTTCSPQLQPNSVDTHIKGECVNSDDDVSGSKRKPPQLEGFVMFKCADGECTIHDHFGGKKCKKHAKQYPYLEVRGEPYETDIEIYLEEQTEKMRYSFAGLMQDTRKQLQQSTAIPYTDVKGYVKLLVAGKAGYDAIKNAKDFFELQDALIETCCSWFNYGIIAEIRKAFLHVDPSDSVLEIYTKDFDAYCKRRCFESPVALHPEPESTESTSQALVFKVEKDFYTSTLTDILQVKRAVAKILGCPPHSINVCSVKEGCVEVHCYVLPVAVINRLSNEQVTQLRRLNVISFKLEGEELLPTKREDDESQHEPLLAEPVLVNSKLSIIELCQSPTNHNRKVFSLSFPPQQTPTPNGPINSSADVYGTESRCKVICKIIDTERKYLRHLEVLLNGYLPVLKELVATPRDLRLLFPTQLEPMMERHEDLLSQLEDRAQVSNREGLSTVIVGDIFAHLCNSEFINMYGAYLKEFKIAVKILAKCEQNSPQFCDQLSMCQHSFFCEGLSLVSYLLTPVQRLQRYELLLKELLKYTPMDHPDNHYIADAIEKLHKGLIRLNHSIKLCLLACSVRQVQSQKSFRFLRSTRLRANEQHTTHANNNDSDSLGDSWTEEVPSRQEEGETEQGKKTKQNKRKETLQSSSRTVQYCSGLIRHFSTNSRDEGISRLSIYSNSSGTSGVGSVSTDQSQLDLSISSLKRNTKPPFTTMSVCSAMPSYGTFRNIQKRRAKVKKNLSLSGRSECTVSRNVSWSNFRQPQKIIKGYVSATSIDCLSRDRPSLCWSEESIEAAMRWDEDIFGNLIGGRSAVSCSDLLLGLNYSSEKQKPSKIIHNIAPLKTRSSISRPLSSKAKVARGSSILDEETRSTSRLSIYSNSSDATSGIGSETQSQLDLTGGSLSGSSRLCTSLPLLPVIPGSPSATETTPPNRPALM